jgi:hypothetical protein
MKQIWTLLAVVLMAATSTAALAADPAADEAASSEWQKTLEVYGWLPNIYITTATQDHITLTLGDLVSNLKFMAMADFAVQKNKWSMMADTIYMHIGDHGEKITGGPFGNPAEVDAQVGIRAFISTFGGGYQFAGNDRYELNVIGGARYIYLKVPIEVDDSVTTGDTKVTLGGHNWDGVIGIRGKTTLNEKWYTNYYADIGTGDSKFTWQAKVGIGYKLKKFTATAGFRYLRWNNGSSNELDNLRILGPYVGAKWFW